MPFTKEAFFAVFALYNEFIWPLQILAYCSGFVALFYLLWGGGTAGHVILSILGCLWVINGALYHGVFFATINPAAYIFGALFLVQAAIFGLAPMFLGEFRFRLRFDLRSAAGLAMILFSLVIYPLWGFAAGHLYPAMPIFGVAPCPTTIFTIGLLLTGEWRKVRWLLPIPALWAAIGGFAALFLGVPQDFALFASFLVVLFFAFGHWRGFSSARHGRSFRRLKEQPGS